MLYRQQNQKIEIIVRRDTAQGAVGTNGLATNRASSTQSTSTELGSNIDTNAGIRQKTLGKLAGAGLMQLGKQVVFSGFSYFVSGIGMTTGDQALQDQIGRKVEVIKDVVNLGTAALSGAMMGASVGGLAGAMVGGLIGVASAGISIGFRQAERERNYNYEMFKTNNEIQYQRARAEINLTTGRVR